MFNVGTDEFILVGIVALVVIGPKDLPRAMRTVGHWLGKARAVTRHFRAGLDEMVRQAELEEMERKWAAENARIMATHPSVDPAVIEGSAGDDDVGSGAGAGTAPSPVAPAVAPAAPAEPAPPANARRKKAAPDKAPPGGDALPLFGPDEGASG